MASSDKYMLVSPESIKKMFVSDDVLRFYLKGGSLTFKTVLLLDGARDNNVPVDGTCDSSGKCSFNTQRTIFIDSSRTDPVTAGEQLMTFPTEYMPVAGTQFTVPGVYRYERDNVDKGVTMTCKWDGSKIVVETIDGYSAVKRDVPKRVVIDLRNLTYQSNNKVDSPPQFSIMTINQVKKFLQVK